MSRQKVWTPRDIELIKAIDDQQVTGYKRNEGDSFRTLSGTHISRQVREFEDRRLVLINRQNQKRYEISLTSLGRELTNKYRMGSFDEFRRSRR